MDTGEGTFVTFRTEEELAKLRKMFPRHGGLFRVGEEVMLKESHFSVTAIEQDELRLKLLKRQIPAEEQQQSLKDELSALAPE